MDKLFGYLLKTLERAKLLPKMNIVVVSDHGMSDLTSQSYLYVGDYVNIELIDMAKSDLRAVSMIHPKNITDV